ncbi:HTH_Tnp_Tc3_2 domain-containing protein [Trichonephila clavipes]|uniref:HTH_Tnp_Tc3_2 domain-containing protein n=1 Tax=Trichonephila clavipes TaxID=2585209 RepID=A0A8X6WF45_TRICX|nr:HTH_Tnp_Tc3_2 domain-containing protein [Trichonephila clavipes]
MSEQRDLPESMAWRVIGRLESGQIQRSVADTVGVARSVVARMWNRFKETGNVRRRPGTGRPRATTSSYDRYIQLTARRNRTENATQLQRQLLLATGRRVSSQTARNRLHEGGLYARRPMVCIPLTHTTVRPEEDGLLNMEIGSNMIGAKCCLQTSPNSV